MIRLLTPLFLVALGFGQGRVVILGIDGMDHGVTRGYLEAGALPELARLGEEGSFAPLLPTNPAQSPTSWSSTRAGLYPRSSTSGSPKPLVRQQTTPRC